MEGRMDGGGGGIGIHIYIIGMELKGHSSVHCQ